jgi:hypothetical protein
MDETNPNYTKIMSYIERNPARFEHIARTGRMRGCVCYNGRTGHYCFLQKINQKIIKILLTKSGKSNVL